MAIVFEDIEEEVYFSLYLFLGGAQAIYAAHLSFESGNVDGRVVTGVRLEYDVGVCWFSIYLCCKFAIFLTVRQYIQKGNFTIFLRFSCEANTGMDAVEALVEWFGGVGGRGVAAKAGPHVDARGDGAEAIIHVDENVVRDGTTIFFGFPDGSLHGVDHPHLWHCYHQTESNGARVLGRMVTIIEDEVGGAEAERNEIAYFLRWEFCSFG